MAGTQKVNLPEQIAGYTSSIIGGSGNFGTVGAGLTRFVIPFNPGIQTGGSWTVPKTGILRNLYLTIETSQPASGSLVVTLYKLSSPTAVTFTIAAGSGIGIYSDTTHSVAVTAGEYIQIQVVNNASGASAQVGGMSLELQIAL